MKKIFIMMFGLLFVASAAFASPTAKGDMVTMNKVDSQVLFGDSSVNVIALGSDEMEVTEGEFWPIFWGLTLYTARYANAPSYGERTYSGSYFSSRRYRPYSWFW